MIKLKDHLDANCKGCMSYKGNNTCGCSVDFHQDENICPCSVCLTKMICNDASCKEWNEYFVIFNPLLKYQAHFLKYKISKHKEL